MGCKGPFREPDFIKFIARSAAMRSLLISSEPQTDPFRRQKINLNSFLAFFIHTNLFQNLDLVPLGQEKPRLAL